MMAMSRTAMGGMTLQDEAITTTVTGGTTMVMGGTTTARGRMVTGGTTMAAGDTTTRHNNSGGRYDDAT